jgi:monoamine oxidase
LDGRPHPLGAHYLPVPGDGAPEVQELLESLALRRRVAGRWVYDERHLCHSPQERLFFRGEWQEGLLPVQGVGPETLAEYQRFARAVARVAAEAPFALPAARGTPAPLHRALDAVTFADWLRAEQFADPHLRWYLDYGCRDDYGADTATVSAWAGLHYFASRHGFQPPGEPHEDADAVLTWPEGNGWLTRQLARPLGDRLRCGQVVLRIAAERRGVRVDAFDTATGQVDSWQARHCVVAMPLLVSARVVENPPTFLREAAARVRYAPWLVANLQLREPLDDRPGAAPAWDNVLYGSAGLGYVDAGHQSLHPAPRATLLTWYLAPGEGARAALLAQPWAHWRDRLLADLSPAHPDLRAKAQRIEVTRYGHAMAVPVPGARTFLAMVPLQAGPMSFAHSDWAGYSVFEEAFTLGHRAGLRIT